MVTRNDSPKRGKGRPSLAQDEATVPITIRLTASQRLKLARLGGAQWIRARIDKAKEPVPE